MPSITLTGLDERTELSEMDHLSRLGAELGFLYTYSPDGRNRYPSRQWLAKTVGRPGQSAVHICGERARQQLYDGSIDDVVGKASRIQVNGTLTPAWLVRVCERYPKQTIITQHHPANLWLLPVASPNHALLVDGSGGRGIMPAAWERPKTDKAVGFAGGLGPDTLRDELPSIKIAGHGFTHDWWVDMEGKLRDEQDWFSFKKARRVMEIWRSSASARFMTPENSDG